METGLPTGSIMKLLTLLLLVRLTLSIHYNAGHTYTMQELVKEVTLITQYGSTVYIGIAMGGPAL